MLTDITFGQYFPGNSFLHRLDPRTKILLLLAFMVALFVFSSIEFYIFFSVFTLFLLVISKVSYKLMYNSLKPLWWIVILTFLIHLFSNSGEVIFKFWIFSATMEGVRQGFLISVRLILLMAMSSFLTFTTSPLALTDGIEKLLNPFRKIGVPAHELAMMTTIALRFVPTLLEEADRIMKAQEARGADFSSGNLWQRGKNLIPLLVPLFIASFRRADELAMAMEARAYSGGEGRTQMKKLQITSFDYVAIATSCLIFMLFIYLQVVGIIETGT